MLTSSSVTATLCLVAAALLVALLVAPDPALAWGKEGHMIVGDIAYSLLTPITRQAVDYYLNGESLASSAPFPDSYDHTSQGKWSEPLHYVNLPRTAWQYTSSDCPFPPGCVVSAIVNFTKQQVAQGNSGPVCTFNDGDMPCPLVFITHFVGDVHQPLHVSYADDEGGNTVKVDFLGKAGNLHQVWDEFIIDKYNSNWESFSKQLMAYINDNPDIVKQYTAITDPVKWANESFQLTHTVVYNYNPSPDASESIYLGENYYNANLPVVKQRLIAGGVRLATLLNNIFSAHTKPHVKPWLPSRVRLQV